MSAEPASASAVSHLQLSHAFLRIEAIFAARFFRWLVQEKMQMHLTLENFEVVSSKIATGLHGSRMWARSPKQTSPVPALHCDVIPADSNCHRKEYLQGGSYGI